jgi:hypothetical protein
MKGQPAPDDGVVAFDQGAQHGRRQEVRPLGAGVGHAGVGLDEKVAHLPRPLFLVDVDERLELAQVVGVAQRVAHAGQPIVGLEVVMDDDPAAQSFGQGVMARGRSRSRQAEGRCSRHGP